MRQISKIHQSYDTLQCSSIFCQWENAYPITYCITVCSHIIEKILISENKIDKITLFTLLICYSLLYFFRQNSVNEYIKKKNRDSILWIYHENILQCIFSNKYLCKSNMLVNQQFTCLYLYYHSVSQCLFLYINVLNWFVLFSTTPIDTKQTKLRAKVNHLIKIRWLVC